MIVNPENTLKVKLDSQHNNIMVDDSVKRTVIKIIKIQYHAYSTTACSLCEDTVTVLLVNSGHG